MNLPDLTDAATGQLSEGQHRFVQAALQAARKVAQDEFDLAPVIIAGSRITLLQSSTGENSLEGMYRFIGQNCAGNDQVVLIVPAWVGEDRRDCLLVYSWESPEDRSCVLVQSLVPRIGSSGWDFHGAADFFEWAPPLLNIPD